MPPRPTTTVARLKAASRKSDNLIRVFNALLTIARLESGQSQGGMTEFDAAGVIRDVGELYDPIAEEAGAKLAIHAPDDAAAARQP